METRSSQHAGEPVERDAVSPGVAAGDDSPR
jgi:hypothetical protein